MRRDLLAGILAATVAGAAGRSSTAGAQPAGPGRPPASPVAAATRPAAKPGPALTPPRAASPATRPTRVATGVEAPATRPAATPRPAVASSAPVPATATRVAAPKLPAAAARPLAPSAASTTTSAPPIAAPTLLASQPVIAPVAVAARPAPPPPAVRMDFPAEPIEVRVLADIVTRRLGIPLLYDESILNKKVTVRVPRDVPEEALLGVLQSALRMKGMALVDAEQPGWKQIVNAPNLAAVGRPVAAGAVADPQDAGAVLSQVFVLERADPNAVVEAVRPLLTQPGGNVQTVSGRRALIVSDYPSVVLKAGQLLRALDGGSAAEVRFVPLRSAEAGQVVTVVNQVLAGRDAGAGGGSGVSLIADDRGNQILVAAPPARLAEVLALIAGLDRGPGLQTVVYRLRYVAPERLDKLVLGLVGGDAGRRAYQSSVDRESGSLVAAATPDVHARIAGLVAQLDVPAAEAQSPVRFYKLKNTKAADVLATVSGLLAEAGAVSVDDGGGAAPPAGSRDGRPPGGAARPPVAVGAAGAATPARADLRGVAAGTPAAASLSAVRPGIAGGLTSNGLAGSGLTGSGITYGASRAGVGDVASAGTTGSGPAAGGAFRGREATVAADVNTNSIVVIAPPDVQRVYADLIQRLDQRRPQVQIECTIVTLDTSDNFSLGVDVGRVGGVNGSKLITFSSFGVSGVDPLTAALTPVAAPGGTFALLNPNVGDVVLRALSTNARSRLVSAPQLLVNDNGRGQLKSVAQEPFAEILDTAANQSRTGLGGQAEAGTSITVEPHISEDDYLQLTYSVELSNFTGASREGLPPPSQKNAVESTVTIPDGHMIVVGGLSVRNLRQTVDSIPLIGRLPVLEYLFGSRTRATTDTTLFVFIRPVILRDDKFEDLKHLSGKSARDAGLPADHPASEPILLR
jgi:general secretion pathway protein D